MFEPAFGKIFITEVRLIEAKSSGQPFGTFCLSEPGFFKLVG